MTEFLIGADPEFFVKKNGQLISAYGLIPGTKAEPHKVNGGAVQVDGMALEININPSDNFDEFNNNIDSVLNELQNMIGPEYEFDFSPVAEFGKEYIDAQPNEAKELGCDPDFNAYTGEANPKPNGDLGIRTASGHIHVGWTKDQAIEDPDHIEACQMVTKQLDCTVGMLSHVWDRDTRRATMYGRMGAYRPKPYGVEYRTPSNAWMNDIRTRRMVFDSTLNSVTRLLNGNRIYDGYYMPDSESYWTNYDWYSAARTVNRQNKLISNVSLADLDEIYNDLCNNPFNKVETSVKKNKSAYSWDAEILNRAINAPRRRVGIQAAPAMILDDVEEIPIFDED